MTGMGFVASVFWWLFFLAMSALAVIIFVEVTPNAAQYVVLGIILVPLTLRWGYLAGRGEK